MRYEAVENFDSPEYGPVSTGRVFEDLPAATARAWCSAGLIVSKEVKPKKESKEVKDNG